MFISFVSEDIFIISSNFTEPLNRSILKHYLKKEILTYEFIISKFSNHKNIEFYKSQIENLTNIIDNLEGFWNNIYIKEEVLNENLLNITKYIDDDNIYYFTIEDVEFIDGVISDIYDVCKSLSDIYDPLKVVGLITLLQSRIMLRDSFIGLDFFRTNWEKRNLEDIFKKYLVGNFLTVSLHEFEQEILYESYRQVLTASGDDFRYLRNKLQELFSEGSGHKEPLFEDIIKIISHVYSLITLERAKYHLSIDIPIYFITHSGLCLIHPDMDKLADYPFHKLLDIRNKRMAFHYISSIDEVPTIPYEDILNNLHDQEYHDILNVLDKTSAETPLIFNSKFDLKKIINTSILEKVYNPFIKVIQDGQEKYISTPLIAFDGLFRFIWTIRKLEHRKRIGTSFENLVAKYVNTKIHPEVLKQRVIFGIPGPREDQRRYEIDIIIQNDDILFCIDCKDYVLLEDPDNFKELSERNGQLLSDCSYHKSKIDSLIRNLSIFKERNKEFSNFNYSIPLILTSYPELPVISENIGIFTLYEFIRLYKAIQELTFKDIDMKNTQIYEDINNVDLKYKILEIINKIR